MKIVSSQIVNANVYDKTIVCKIVGIAERKNGKYQVSPDGGKTSFDAYSSDTGLKRSDNVYVMIPEGNYDNQKLILGKKMNTDINESYIFTEPFDTIIDLTDNVISEENSSKDFGLLANDPSKEIIDLYDDIDCSQLDIEDFTKMGIKADFRTLLPNVIEGEFGIQMVITYQSKIPDVETHNLIESKTKIESYRLLDVTDMLGNPYNFSDYYTQQKVIDITNYGSIKSIKLQLYQKAGTFKEYDYDENEIVNTSYKLGNEKFPNNIFVKNIYLCFGYDISSITEDTIFHVVLNQNGKETYSKYRDENSNQKTIKLRWVHMFDTGPRVVTKDDFDSELNGQLADYDYEIAWYRYHLGVAPADAHCGIYWSRCDVNNKYFLEDNNINKDYQPSSGSKIFNVNFNPNTHSQQEKIKAIISFTKKLEQNESEIYNYKPILIRSKEIIFENEQNMEEQQTIDYNNTLTIECNDGSLGNYLIYGNDLQILDTVQSKVERELSCKFTTPDNGVTSDLLLDISKGDRIQWRIPFDINRPKSLMIILQEVEKNSDGKYYYRGKEIKKIDINGFEWTEDCYYKDGYLYINDTLNIDGIAYPKYKINSQCRNQIKSEYITCTICKDGQIYSTTKEFTFGVAGIMGTKKTLVVDFVDPNKHAFTIEGEIDDQGNSFKDSSVLLQIKEYDETGEEIEYAEGFDEEYIWTWYSPASNRSCLIIEAVEGEGSNVKQIKYKNDLTEYSQIDIEKDFYILKVSRGKLETYFPIPLRYNPKYVYIDGVTQLTYLSDGTTYFDNLNSDVYSLYNIENKKIVKFGGNLELSIASSDVTKPTPIYLKSKNDNFTLDAKEKTYFSNFAQCAVIFKDKLTNQILWQQPILVIKNNYASRTINGWDGTFVMNADEGTILSTAVAAGTKNTDNTFTGVLIGDWRKEGTDKSLGNTGLYGFNHGEMVYAFKDDGKAFIGADGKGRINFDGNHAKIFSAGYGQDVNQQGYYSGMEIDMETPKLWLWKKEGTNEFGTLKSIDLSFGDTIDSDYPQFTMIGADSKIKFSTEPKQTNISLSNNSGGNVYLGFKDDNPKFSMTTGEGGSSIEFNAIRGKGSNITLVSPQVRQNGKNFGENYQIKLDSNIDESSIPFTIGEKNAQKPNFSVSWNGSLYSYSGEIGGWEIHEDSLKHNYWDLVDENNERVPILELNNRGITSWQNPSSGEQEGGPFYFYFYDNSIKNSFERKTKLTKNDYCEVGWIGVVSGRVEGNLDPTENLGIKTIAHPIGKGYYDADRGHTLPSIILESANNIRLSADGPSGYVILQGKNIRIEGSTLYVEGIAAENQHGIYARFA